MDTSKNNQPRYFSSSINEVIEFLIQKFEKDEYSYASLNTYRSALSLILDIDITNNSDIKRFFKAIVNRRPKPKYNFIWDPSDVLKFLSTWYPNEELTLERITKKLVTILALTSAQRVQTLSLIKIKNIVMKDSKAYIKIPDKIKTSGKNRFQPLIELSSLEEHPEIYVLKLLNCYLEKT